MMKNVISYVLLIIILFSTIIGCSPATRKKNVSAREETGVMLTPGSGDAYLFDIKINQDGRKRSSRLDVYFKPDTLAIFARAYLGKGVMKSALIGDSALVYFPTENEYYNGSLYDLLDEECYQSMRFERILQNLFLKLPVEIEDNSVGYYVVILQESKSICRYRLESRMCEKYLEIEYDFKDDRYIPYKIEYSNDDESLKLSAKRRSYSLNIKIPPEKMSIDIPPDAAQIIPR